MEHVILRWETARCATDEVMTPPLTRRFAPPSRTKSFSPLAGRRWPKAGWGVSRCVTVR